MEDKNYRYTTLTGPADITRSGVILRVILHDSSVNPNGKHLRFDYPLDSDPDSNPPADGTIQRANVHIVAGLNLAWFNYHTQVDGFKFKNEQGDVAQRWEDLDDPKRDGGDDDEMDPVKPDDDDDDLLTGGGVMDPIKPDK